MTNKQQAAAKRLGVARIKRIAQQIYFIYRWACRNKQGNLLNACDQTAESRVIVDAIQFVGTGGIGVIKQCEGCSNNTVISMLRDPNTVCSATCRRRRNRDDRPISGSCIIIPYIDPALKQNLKDGKVTLLVGFVGIIRDLNNKYPLTYFLKDVREIA